MVNQFRILCYVLFFSVGWFQSPAQDGSSIAIEKARIEVTHSLQTSNETQQLMAYLKLVDLLIEDEQYTAALTFIQAAEELYLAAPDNELKADYCLLAGDAYHYNTNFLLADRYFKKNYNICKTLNDKEKEADAAKAISQNLNYLSRYDKSYAYALEAMDIYKALNLESQQNEMKSFMAWLLIIGKEWSKAEHLIKEALMYYQRVKDSVSVMVAYEDLANIAIKKGQTDKALELIQIARTNYQKWNDLDGIITSSFLLAEVHEKKKEWAKVKSLMLELLEYFEATEDKRDRHEAFRELGKAYMNEGNFEAAQTNFKEFLLIGKRVNEQGIDIEYHELMQQLYMKARQYKKAVQEAEKLAMARDSFNVQQQQQLIRELNSGYETAEKEKKLLVSKERNARLKKENELLEKDKALQRSTWWFRTSIIVLIALIVSIIFYVQRLRQQRQNEQLKRDKALMNAQLEAKNKALQAFTKNMLEKNALIEQFEAELESLTDKGEQQKIQEKKAALYNMKILTNEDWLKFRQLFIEVHPDFLDQLIQQIPDLTEGDQRFLLLLKLNIPSRQMADMLGVSQSSIRVSRHRIKKKIGLAESAQLIDWLNQR